MIRFRSKSRSGMGTRFDALSDAILQFRSGAFAALILLMLPLSGCSTFSSVPLPSFGFTTSSISSSPDCEEIEKRMKSARRQYAAVLGREKPAVYLTFTGHLSRTMKKQHLRGAHEMSESSLETVVRKTRQSCSAGNLPHKVCRGAGRLGRAYRPLVLAARDAHKNYCGNRPIE